MPLARCQMCMDMHSEDNTHDVFTVPWDFIGKELMRAHLEDVHKLEIHVFQV